MKQLCHINFISFYCVDLKTIRLYKCSVHCLTVVNFVLLAPAAQTETVAVCQSCFGVLTSTSDKIKAS